MTSWNGLDYQSSLGLLIDCLEKVPSLRDPARRRLCLDIMVDDIGVALAVDDLPTTRAHLIGIVQACRRQHPRALSAFINAVEQVEPGSIPVQRARAAVEEITALNLLRDKDREDLLSLLGKDLGIRLAELVRSVGGPAAEMTLAKQYPTEVVAALEQMTARPDGVPPLLAFVEHLAAYCGDQRAEQLRQWNDRQAEHMGLIKKLLAVRLEQAAEPMTPQDVVACLVIRIEPDMLEPELYTVVPWRQHDPVEWRPERGEQFVGYLEAVHSHVAELVAEAETGWAKDASAIRIEFLLPYPLLNLPADQWDLEAGSVLPRPMGVHYQVVIRSLDRARSPRWHREWRQRWEQLKRAPAGLTTPDWHWLWSDGLKPRQLTALDAKLAVHKEVVSLVLRSVPDEVEPGEVMVGLRTGVPVMIWQRTESARSAFEAEVKAMRGALPELVENLRLLRSRAKQAARPDSHVGSRISLLWDDPDRPVEPQDSPMAPMEEVSVR